jgi:hypothetical protein
MACAHGMHQEDYAGSAIVYKKGDLGIREVIWATCTKTLLRPIAISFRMFHMFY